MFDKACQEKHGDFSAIGESFLCKYLHHSMIPLSSEHCFHAGPGKSDSKGHLKCHRSQCQHGIKEDTNPPTDCSEGIVLALERATMMAFPLCLEGLFTGNCTSNCSQAINTFFSAFSDDQICECSQSTKSGLLRSLGVQSATLFGVCQKSTTPRAPSCLAKRPHEFPTVCANPRQYNSVNGCRQWNWAEQELGYLNEFRICLVGMRCIQL